MNSNERLAKAIETGVPVPGTPAQAAELVAHENVAAARMARSAEAASTSRWMADRRATVRADSDRYMLTGLPGRPVFDGVTRGMTSEARAKIWAREEFDSILSTDAGDDEFGELLLAIGKALTTGELPDYVDDDSRRGSCCGVTFKTETDDEGTTYICPLCGKDGAL